MKQWRVPSALSWLLLLWVSLVYGWGVVAVPGLHYRDPLAAFTLLMVLHGGAHWMSFHLRRQRRLRLPYFLGQALLVLAISAFARDVLLIGALYLPLIGEAILILEFSGLAVLTVISHLTLFALTAWWLGGKSQISYAYAALALPLPLVVGIAVLLVRQAESRERTEAALLALEAAQAKERTLAAERARMARELHDTLAQGVAGLILQLEAVDAQFANERPERAHAIVQQAMGRARSVLAEARRAIDDLRLEMTGQGDLAEQIREEVSRFTAATGIPCTLQVAVTSAVPVDLGEHVLRTVSEGLANSARHAQAHQTWVQISEQAGMLEVVVRDDGCGFEIADVAGQAGHYGLLGLRERARLAGGTLEVRSAPGAGTTIRFLLPLTSER
jgi:NarL family two-component system sensor histidine kinase YdfH